MVRQEIKEGAIAVVRISMACHGWITGTACIGYDWGYRPLCEHILHVEPWTPPGYGVGVLTLALVAFAFRQIALQCAAVNKRRACSVAGT